MQNQPKSFLFHALMDAVSQTSSDPTALDSQSIRGELAVLSHFATVRNLRSLLFAVVLYY